MQLKLISLLLTTTQVYSQTTCSDLVAAHKPCCQSSNPTSLQISCPSGCQTSSATASLSHLFPGARLFTVLDRGFLKCGVKNNAPTICDGCDGMATGTETGTESELCRKVAVHLFSNATALEYVDLQPQTADDDRFGSLNDGTVDVLLRTTTITQERIDKYNVSAAHTYSEDPLYAMSATNVPIDLSDPSIAICYFKDTVRNMVLPHYPSATGRIFEDHELFGEKLMNGNCTYIIDEQGTLGAGVHVASQGTQETRAQYGFPSEATTLYLFALGIGSSNSVIVREQDTLLGTLVTLSLDDSSR